MSTAVFLRSDSASQRKALYSAVGKACGCADTGGIDRLIAIPSNEKVGGYLWEVQFCELAFANVLRDLGTLHVLADDGNRKEVDVVTDGRVPATYRLSGLQSNTRYVEVLQAFSNHGHVLQFNQEALLDDDSWTRMRKTRVGMSRLRVTILPRTAEPPSESLVLIIHDDTVQCVLVQRTMLRRYESDNTDTDGNALSDPCEYFSASAGEETQAQSEYAATTNAVPEPSTDTVRQPDGKSLKVLVLGTTATSTVVDDPAVSAVGVRSIATLERPPNQSTLAEASAKADSIAQALIDEEAADKALVANKDQRRKKRRQLRSSRPTSVQPAVLLPLLKTESVVEISPQHQQQLLARIQKLEATAAKLASSLATSQATAVSLAAQFSDRERALEQKVALSGCRRKELEEQLRAERRRKGALRSSRGRSDPTHRPASVDSSGANSVGGGGCRESNGGGITSHLEDSKDDRVLSSAYSTLSLNSTDSQSTNSVWSLMSVDPAEFTPPTLQSPAAWNGHGSPLLLHLLYAAHVIQPHLVAGLHAACCTLATRPVLVGACAWHAHCAIPIDTDDLDFVLEGGHSIQEVLRAAVRHAAAHPAVRARLSVVARISALTRRGASSPTNPDEAARFAASVAAAEDGGDNRYTEAECAAMLQLAMSETGWRVKLGHQVLLDLCPSTGNIKVAAAVTRSLATLLPSRSLYSYEGDPETTVAVAPLPALIRGLERSLRSTCSWRIKKDLVRLRLVFHSVWLQMHGDPTAMESFAMLRSLVVEFDPLMATLVSIDQG